MNKKKLSIIKKISLKQFKDNRGSLTRVFCFRELNKLDIKFNIKQINQVNIKKKGTIKGMHFQIKPFEEDKIVKLVSGKILDIVVDVRKNSKNFLKHKTFVLSSKENKILFIPKGFAHGFQTLTNDCEIIYMHSQYYKPTHEKSINPLDPKISINWPLKISLISNKDKLIKFI